jgi:hypothetical protein
VDARVRAVILVPMGCLAGQQEAFSSTYLIRAKLPLEAIVGSMVVSRLSVAFGAGLV